LKLRFYTATPLNVEQGSGTYTGLHCLVQGLREAGATVEIVGPRTRLPNYTVERYQFNRWLPTLDRSGCQATIGYDLDGYRLVGSGGPPHIAAVKGVIADELIHERGLNRLLLRVQSRWERRHVQRASRVTTSSAYSAGRIAALYGPCAPVQVIPEPIHLAHWRQAFRQHPAAPDPHRFTILCVCRFFPRKRVDVLLRAAALARHAIANLQLRIIGDGADAPRLRALAHHLGLAGIVHWLGNAEPAQLAREYQQCDAFCLPSVQEGFGVVFLEAMAAGRPIVAVRAAAAPEVVPHALLALPDNPASLAAQFERLAADRALRAAIGQEGFARVQQFDQPVVAAAFLRMVEELL
jgi:glycosyltransferase involved in cell wall biosynthesis